MENELQIGDGYNPPSSPKKYFKVDILFRGDKEPLIKEDQEARREGLSEEELIYGASLRIAEQVIDTLLSPKAKLHSDDELSIFAMESRLINLITKQIQVEYFYSNESVYEGGDSAEFRERCLFVLEQQTLTYLAIQKLLILLSKDSNLVTVNPRFRRNNSGQLEGMPERRDPLNSSNNEIQGLAARMAMQTLFKIVRHYRDKGEVKSNQDLIELMARVIAGQIPYKLKLDHDEEIASMASVLAEIKLKEFAERFITEIHEREDQ